jgi:3',5'-cyclic-nucleotide phosphodiesterase
VQHSDKLDAAWRRLAPLVRAHALKAIVIETSYPDGTPDSRLYGHLTPAWLARELGRLETYAGGGGALRGLDVFITHIKPSFDPAADPRRLIGEQLRQANRFGLRLHLARQGDWFRLPP